MARIDKIKEEIGLMKLKYGFAITAYLSLMFWIIQDTSAYVSLVQRLVESVWSDAGWLLWLAVTALPVLYLTVMVVVADLAIRKKIDLLEEC